MASLVSESSETKGDHVDMRGLCCLLETMVTSEPWLWHRAMSVSIVLSQLQSVLVSVTPDTTKGHADAMGLDSHLRLC